MATQHRPSRKIICEVCQLETTTIRRRRDICVPCHRKQPSQVCRRCVQKKQQVSEETGLCPQCTEIESRPVAICSHCNRTETIHNQEDWLCVNCHARQQYEARRKSIRGEKVICSICNQLKVSQLLGQAVCKACCALKDNGIKVCSGCHKNRAIHHKSKNLCRYCNADRLAGISLQRYLTDYSTPYSYNKALFDLLVTTIEWNSCDEKTNRRFRTFGNFLQTYQLPQPLTWEGIEKALPRLEKSSCGKPKYIRSCLLNLGYLLADRGEIEDRAAYIEKRKALNPISHSPEHMRLLLQDHLAWLWKQNMRSGSIKQNIEAVAKFWAWADQRGIKSPEQVQPSLIEDYLSSLYWAWHCSACQAVIEFDPGNRDTPENCIECGAIHSMSQVDRYIQNTVRNCRAGLNTFFKWAKVEQKVLINPVRFRVEAPQLVVQHYSPEIVRELCKCIPDPDTDPLEAIVLYLIIFHALSVQELRHAQIPSVASLNDDIPILSFSEHYYLNLPKSKPTRGNTSPGRPDVPLDFPDSASTWLKPLLDRYEHQRQAAIDNPNNKYLIVTTVSARRNMPVGPVHIWNIVQQASLRILGAACNPNTLRKTTGIMFADRAGNVLRWMGWHDDQAFRYTWMQRLVVQPEPTSILQDMADRNTLIE